jgi:hypothetical protein
MSGAIGFQQWHKGPWRYLAATSEEGDDNRQLLRGRIRRQELRLGSLKTLYEALGQTLELEVVNRAVGASIRLRKMNVREQQ